MGDAEERRVRRLIGVYNADGSVLGELRYQIARARGTAHCELCDITHGRLRKKRAFGQLQASYPVPIELVHRDEQPDAVAAVTQGETPCVVAETEGGFEVVLDTDDLARCHGDVKAFEQALTTVLDRPEARD